MKCIIKRSDGGISILALADATDFDLEVEKWKTTAPGQYISHRLMDDTVVPTDRYFRNAWADTTPELVIDFDLPKCRDIQRAKMRAARAPLLAALDTQYLQADEAGDVAQKRQIAAQKQQLRDTTADPRLEAATTPELIRAVWPPILGKAP